MVAKQCDSLQTLADPSTEVVVERSRLLLSFEDGKDADEGGGVTSGERIRDGIG
jgi:hypothetical protein